MKFPSAVPEIPVADLHAALDYYSQKLGFTVDWGEEEHAIAGISRGACRLFVADSKFRSELGNVGPILIWLNVDSKAEVDELFAEWKASGARIVEEPEDKPWLLREFIASDLDGNLLRVFYDFRREGAGKQKP